MSTASDDDEDPLADYSNIKYTQETLNTTHPFGIKIWKPALYRKSRTVNRNADLDVHSTPGVLSPKSLLNPANILWSLLFGWWIALAYMLVIILVFLPLLLLTHVSPSHQKQILIHMASYIFWPFGKYITRNRNSSSDETPLIIPELSQSFIPFSGETLVNDRMYQQQRASSFPTLRFSILKNIQSSGLISAIFHITFSIFLAPIHLAVCGLCFFLIFPIPIGKLNYLLIKLILKNPLELSCHSSPVRTLEDDIAQQRPLSGLFWRFSSSNLSESDTGGCSDSPILENIDESTLSTVVLCIYKSAGLKYYKYTYDGINIVIINMISIIIFTLIDFYIIAPKIGNSGIASHGVLFSGALFSIIPLAYFIGQAVSSITAQTGNIALGSVINATFGSIIEIILYCLAIIEGKERMVEGAIIGSILCGLLALPGVSMFSGGLKRKEQSFNVKAAGVSTTMLLMAVLGVFSPTIFQMIFGLSEMHCKPCPLNPEHPSCQQCRFINIHPTKDPIYIERTRPLMFICVFVLIVTYAVGLWFTLRTHTKKIYSATKSEGKRIKRVVQFLKENAQSLDNPETVQNPQIIERPRSEPNFSGLLKRNVKEALKDSNHQSTSNSTELHNQGILGMLGHIFTGDESDISSESGNDDLEHDNPNWSSLKSCVVLLGCTILYSVIAEVLISSVDGFLASFPVDEKFLGLTLFAIAPTVTEFYNAISFARAGNIALSLEIGSAYVIQVALLQIPALIIFSELYLNLNNPSLKGFTLIFSHWDLYSVFFSLFILSYIYIEGKSNYFKGAMLLLAYFLLMSAFLFVPVDVF